MWAYLGLAAYLHVDLKSVWLLTVPLGDLDVSRAEEGRSLS
jgi:hypothetical protein